MDTKTKLTLELQALVNKWKSKPEPLFMSKEYINRRFDRIRYIKLRAQIKKLDTKDGGKPDIVEIAKEIFEIK